MRMFLNAIFDFKPKDKAFVTVPPILREILKENAWVPNRLLFDLYDINEAASEAHTPHAKLMKKFPQLQPYWHNTSQQYAARSPQSVLSNEPPPPILPHEYGFFSNFPGRKDGTAVFCPHDPAIDMDVLEGICAAIPRPCSFYTSIIMWDAISWYPDSDLTPALRSIQYRHGMEDFAPGEWNEGHEFYECCVGYQGNCLLLSNEYDVGPELEVRVELTEQHPLEEALKIIELFARRLGKPVKQCVRAVFPWEMRDEITTKLANMRIHFDSWNKAGIQELQSLYHQAQKNPPDRPVSAKTLAKRFVERNSFARHDLCRWDDYGWCKRLPQGYWLHLELSINPTARYAQPVALRLVCYGINFQITYGCCPHLDFAMPKDTPADEAAFQVFQAALNRFEDEMVPQLAATFGETPETFYQHSYAFDYSREFDV